MEAIELLGVRFHKLTRAQLFEIISRSANSPQKVIIANVNVHAMNLAYELPWFRDFLNRADFVFCDGLGVALAARLTGQTVNRQHRLTCPDWIEALAMECSRQDLSLFLLGGKPGVADTAAARLQVAAPGLRLAAHHGFFDKSGPENDQVIATINAFQPHILYVGFGMPRQESWIKDNMLHIEARVFLPLGACLDFYTGNIYRGPRWLTDYGFEWLTRLLTEPRRLGRRYLIGNPQFFWRVLKTSISVQANKLK